MIDRRHLLAGAGALTLAGCATSGAAGSTGAFVRREGQRLVRNGKPYRFVGANVWYAAWLGADADFGDRTRLTRELDRLRADGVTNIRANASAEDSPLTNSVKPAFRDASATYNETLLVGLDWFLVEAARRDMTVVLYLTNFWEWSGGMMTYLSWVNGGRYINMNDPAHPWPAFPDFIADFYRSEAAVGLYHDYVRAVVGRTNAVTGRRYADDPTIMSWQLANEPRAAGGEAAVAANQPAFLGWIETTARLIKSIDPNHLVSTGSEGLKGSGESEAFVLDAHRPAVIDYLTAHIWPGNWGWLDQADIAGTDARSRDLTRDYIARHVAMARTLDKPLVIEEFGYPRDAKAFDPAAPTTARDGFYDLVMSAVEADQRAGGALVGSNFWAWNGEGRAEASDARFRSGDTAWLGDPPHEPQGWYGVFDGDASTRAVVRRHAEALTAIS